MFSRSRTHRGSTVMPPPAVNPACPGCREYRALLAMWEAQQRNIAQLQAELSIERRELRSFRRDAAQDAIAQH